LRRRAEMIARPARVRIRSRKPCVLARRRLFGWKVRLLTVRLHQSVQLGVSRTWSRGCDLQRALTVGRHGRPPAGRLPKRNNGTDRPGPGSNRPSACPNGPHYDEHPATIGRHAGSHCRRPAALLVSRTVSPRGVTRGQRRSGAMRGTPIHSLWTSLWIDRPSSFREKVGRRVPFHAGGSA
jgi:hypothetical protein